MPMSKAQGHTVSDLHLLTSRSSAHRLMPRLHRAASEAGLFVLNGDIFDFQWSVYGRLSWSLEYAEDWISDLVSRHPHCQFVFITGNHDSIPAYKELLSDLSDRYDNLAWEAHYLRLGRKVFLHGDVRDSHTPERLAAYRARWHKPPQKRWVHAAYFVFTWSRIPRLIHGLVPTQRLTTGVTKYLRAELGLAFDEVRDIYCGHTHRPLTDYRWGNLRFHNTGAAIQGVRFRIQTFTYHPAELERALHRPRPCPEGIGALAE
jgi:UDP-2,3-diacylglucosamine pyrophosphatase LpxH